ncbi:alpha-aminoadipic semialdehyde synthase, mitochondrial isoform X1 [Dermacentor andersoni]|uniref:alpha-aminoadipic semialdehyde synthase, mitochondrial isoform X1 n=1 Tax=Dermacentor andersoni TaxID=34620 RepID=UPI00215571D5|nr:alpha-aminoadipic semialdehyde synthase, mitochondrial-like isoform X1 [Dermacentor andersoni]XP_054924539.1 alpha-aminoadipic semialdehyde synthase, mitochondrial-like isoform X1 [Dermacentor andersoni]XP_054924540.1 alpha-aminoadipic semialdehyde synthase, mitochondrial-like isoform X1 [Dermacentor andersoni]
MLHMLKGRRLPCLKAVLSRCSSELRSARHKTIAIRREDASLWERRAPLAPHHVRALAKSGVKVYVQPSNRRAYPIQAYVNAGAEVREDISDVPVIIGVKQVPIDQLHPNKTYVFFSHTIKAQEANMPMLDVILERNIRLIDYERMCDENGSRVVAFGKYAGKAGMINILHGLGLRLLALGHHTPFMHIGPAHNYRNSGMAKQAVRDAGYEIALAMMPRSIGPLTFVFTGSGNVSQGAQDIFESLPCEWVDPRDLREVCEQGAITKVYGAVVSRDDHYRRIEDDHYDPEECDQFPERYYSTFSKDIAPYASVIVNGIYWAVNSPKLLTIPDAKRLLQPTNTPWLPSSAGGPSLPHRLLAICDISADPGGSIEFMNECTTIDAPFCLYDADQHKNTESFAGPGVLVCSIDNMPTQLPLEATDYFGKLLMPYINDIMASDATKPLSQHRMSPVVEGAVIASNGKLTPNYEYIEDLRNTSRSMKKAQSATAAKMKKVLVLGAGYVSAPLVEYLTRDDSVHVVVGTAFQKEGEALAIKSPNTESVVVDVTKTPDAIQNLIKDADLVVSLLPYPLHPTIAQYCIAHKTNMVTASYLTPEMKELHSAAADANITVMNEVGLDPGIDHLLAMECFDEVRRKGGKVLSFVSYCGGLPAPEHANNPLRYKISWNPRSAFVNCMGPARYLENGKEVEIAPGSLLDNAQRVPFLPGFNLEGYPNRDSLVYKNTYGINNAHTVLRGTLRYKGFSSAMKGLQLLGLLSTEPHPSLHPRGPEITWRLFMTTLMGQPDNLLTSNIKNLIYDRVDKCEFRTKAIEDLGLLDDIPVEKKNTPLDTLMFHLSNRLAYEPGERDIVIMRHDIGIQWHDEKKEMRHVDMVTYGDPNGYSAMAKTVGYPAAIAAKMILQGEIQAKGMVLPFAQEIYGPMIQRLKNEGIRSSETTTKNYP